MILYWWCSDSQELWYFHSRFTFDRTIDTDVHDEWKHYDFAMSVPQRSGSCSFGIIYYFRAGVSLKLVCWYRSYQTHVLFLRRRLRWPRETRSIGRKWTATRWRGDKTREDSRGSNLVGKKKKKINSSSCDDFVRSSSEEKREPLEKEFALER